MAEPSTERPFHPGGRSAGIEKPGSFQTAAGIPILSLDVWPSADNWPLLFCKIDEKYKIFKSGQSVVDLVGQLILENL